MGDFWEPIHFQTSDTEAVVETRFVIPLLEALGYDQQSDVVPKQRVQFQQGRTVGRPNEADFAVYAGPIQSPETSLITVEVKRPTETLVPARRQCESYAIVLRTPFYLLTNGVELELWQLQTARESTLILACTLSELPAVRGQIEALVSKQAAVTHCRSLWNKNVSAAAGDAAAYIENEVRRTAAFKPFVRRTLATGNVTLSTDDLLTEYSQGALITGPSGFGKTELSRFVFQATISRFAVTKKLPFDVKLPEVVAQGVSILEYVQQRISAHCPQFTPAKLNDVLRSEGAVFACDGFERVSSPERRRVAAEISTIHRDFPRVAVFVFSRPSCATSVSLPRLELQGLTDEQIRDFQECFFSGPGQNVSWGLTSTLRARLSHPIFLELTCKHHAKHRSTPSTLTSLFDGWLNRSLEWDDPSPAVRAQREAALSLLAEKTLNSPLSRSEVFLVLREAGFEADVFNALVESDALETSQDTVELVHEALADFLRARQLASKPFEQFVSMLSKVTFRNDSLFGTLLMGLITEPQYQRAVWQRLYDAGAREYLGSFKFKADASPALLQLSDVDAQVSILEDILDGFEQTGRTFFPELWNEMCIEEIGDCDCKLAITGSISSGLTDARYSIHSRQACEPRVEIGRLDSARHWRGINFTLSTRAPDSGRLLGTDIVRRSLLQIVEGRRLKGGLALARERLASRMNLLVQRYGYPQHQTALTVLIQTLAEDRSDYVPIGQFSRDPKDFWIEDVIKDAETCQEGGDSQIDLWWRKYADDQGCLADKMAPEAMVESFDRAESIFNEVLADSFSHVRAELQGFAIRPVQWLLQVNTAGGGAWPLEHRWFPVEKPLKPSVVLKNMPATNGGSWWDKQIYADTIAELARLGRRTDVTVLLSASRLPDFDGYSSSSQFTGETPAMQLAHEWVKDELEELFSDFHGMP